MLFETRRYAVNKSYSKHDFSKTTFQFRTIQRTDPPTSTCKILFKTNGKLNTLRHSQVYTKINILESSCHFESLRQFFEPKMMQTKQSIAQQKKPYIDGCDTLRSTSWLHPSIKTISPENVHTLEQSLDTTEIHNTATRHDWPGAFNIGHQGIVTRLGPSAWIA
jgi:hypothetical protein